MIINHTAFSYIKSKNLDLIMSYIWKLPFKIEIKGNPVYKGKAWYVFFIYHDKQTSLIKNGPKIIDLDKL